MTIHPFDSIKDFELRSAARLVKKSYSDTDVHFVQIDRLDPPKDAMLKYLEAEKLLLPLPRISRVAYCYYYTKNGSVFNKALVNVSEGHVITKTVLPKGVVGPILPEDILEIEEYSLKHPRVVAEIEKLILPPGYEVVSEPWIYGTDDNNENRLLSQCYMYLRAKTSFDSNHYSIPLTFSPVFETISKTFVRMDYLPTGYDGSPTQTLPWKEVEPVEYHPDLLHEVNARIPKPLIVEQPEGPGFAISKSNEVEWQGWSFVVATNVREGFAIYDISFKGRSIAYRLSLSEMTVPYGDPRPPFHRKQAFDLGDAGFGTNANRLELGCDCLGVIKYLDTLRTNGEGEPILIPNSVCMHEQDNGILYKHVNYRTGNPVVARRREFVVQTIATVGNYEYILNIIFDQVGEICIQVRATGILSTMPIEENNVVNFGTNVAKTALASYHQHLLSFRIDTAIDGPKNTVVYDDVYPMEENTALNPFNVGFYTQRTILEKAGSVEQSPFTNRSYKIINENVINPVTKAPVGYKIEMPARQMLLGTKNSFNAKRAHFATKQLWVTKYSDNQLYAAGEFTNQSKEDTGLAKWVTNSLAENVRNNDVVVWPTLGFTHVPRAEDFPVMPVEIHEIKIVPSGFFEKNPALDLPQADQKQNKSVLMVENDKSSSNVCCKTVL
ncbi:hypothetical protein PACTADRAFT_51832 [Pachysolen tannophilus NRRL Y-2460]|uniref:Amine oxidase n=1 Tax=Pachysolen tannophilus NRRL Y-2460 TaxID=669874 RepID=A0A1E4TNA8_PACTA|nr:hypothetical protein PACTADRAFT_51832 [Pachysolen tannophilus NRRL Y-2460]